MSYSSEVLADAPLGYWKLNETSGTVLADSSGSGRNGTYSGATLGQPPLHAGNTAAAKGGATGQGIGSVPNGAWMGNPTEYTVEFWYKPNNTNDVKGIVSRWANGGRGWIIWQRRGQIACSIITTSQQDRDSGVPLVVGRTYHVALVCKGASLVMYVDGDAVLRTTVGGDWGAGINQAIQIGGYAGGNYSEATLSDLAYYDKALSSERIYAHATGDTSPPAPVDPATVSGLVGRWDAQALTGLADGAAVASMADLSGHGKDAVPAIAGQLPTYKATALNGHPVVRFDGRNALDAMGVLGPNDPTYTVIFVGAVQDVAASSAPWSVQGNGGGMCVFVASGQRGFFNPGNWVHRGNAGNIANGEPQRWAMLNGPSSSQLLINGGDTVYFDSVAGVGTNLRMSNTIGQDNPSKVDVGEMLIFDRPLTGREIRTIDLFLAQKWAAGPSGATGGLDAQAPGHTAAFVGTVTAAPTTGALSVVGPAHVAALSGITPAGPITGTLAATAPAHTAAMEGATLADPVAGTLAATGPRHGVALAGTTNGISLRSWTKDNSRRTRAVALTSGTLDFTPPLAIPPASVRERVIMRESVIVPALDTIPGAIKDPATGQLRIPDDVYDALPRVVEEVGSPRVVFPNIGSINDRTFWRGGIIRPLRDRREEPFGDVDLTLELPQVTSMDPDADSPTNDSPMNWSRNRTNVEIVMRRSDATIRRGVWTGHAVTHDGGNDDVKTGKSLTCHGTLWQAAGTLHRSPNLLDQTDIGTLIPAALNDVVSRRYPKIPNVTTGIMSRQRGTWDDSQMAFAQELLATAWTTSGRQWTIAKVEGTRRTYRMRLKKTAPSWTITNGARGVKVQLAKDATTIRNVVFGHGVGPDGYAWWNYHYPNLRQDDAPAYPYSSAGSVMSIGSTDAGTASGEGVSVWQARARNLGYKVTVDGVYSAADAAACRAIQRRYGLQVDGVVGPQTWAGTFDVGGNGGDLSGAIRLPLAADPRTQKWLYNADGSIAGENPKYDVNVIAYEANVDFGSGVTREQGIEAAQQIVDRESEPGLVGRIVLDTDPREGTRFYIPPGDKITLIGYEGADRVLHITAVERDWENLTVTLEVDERARDAMTVQQILVRNKAARKDPARKPGNINRRSNAAVDQVIPYDGESGAGWIPRMALYPGLWSVVRIPVSELGRVARIDLTTSGPAAKFAVALFGSEIQPVHLRRYVGNPLASDDPFGPKATLLEDRFGFIEGWGQKGQACGYGHGAEDRKSTLTGKFHDTGGFEYVSQRPPWIWVAMFSASATFIRGRILPASIQ